MAAKTPRLKVKLLFSLFLNQLFKIPITFTGVTRPLSMLLAHSVAQSTLSPRRRQESLASKSTAEPVRKNKHFFKSCYYLKPSSF